MKKVLTLFMLLVICLPQVEAQRYKDARSYYREFSSQGRRIQIKNMRYMEAIAKGDDERRIKKFRQMVVDQLKESQKAIQRVGPYKEDDVLHREYLQGLDMYIEAYETLFGKAEELLADRYKSIENLEAYYKLANEAEVKALDAAYKIEKAEDFFGKTYQVDLRRDTVIQEKMLRLDEMIVSIREVTLEYFRVDAEMQRLFNAIDSNKTDNLSEIIGDIRRANRTAMTAMELIEPMEDYEDLQDQAFYFFEEVEGSIDEELSPMVEVYEFKYKDQDDLQDAQEALISYKEFLKEMRIEFFEVRSEMILSYLEE